MSDTDKLGSEITRAGVVVVLGTIMAIFDTTIVAVALPALARAFHEGVSTIQWVTTAYLLALAIVIPISGWAVHRIGAKPTFMISLTLFVVGSAACGLAWSATSLIIFRVVQGFGGGMIMPVGQSIMARMAGPQRMGKVMGYIGIPTLLGPILGPVVGGLIISNVSWRWIFFVNVPIGIVTLLLCRTYLPKGDRDQDHRFDFIGFILLSPGLALVTYGLSEVGARGSFSGNTVWWPLILGMLLIAGFIWRSFGAPEPLIEMSFFRNRTFTVSQVTIFLIGATIYGTMFLLPLYYQIALGDPAWKAGLMLAPQGIGAALMMRPAGGFADRHGTRNVALVGAVLMTAGTFAFTMVTGSTSLWTLGIALFVRGIGLGCLMMPVIAASYRVLNRHDVPKATSATNIIRQVGGSFGVAIFAVVLETNLRSIFGPSAVLATSGSQPTMAISNLVSHAFAQTFWWSAGACALTIVPVLFMPPMHLQVPPDDEAEIATESAIAMAD